MNASIVIVWKNEVQISNVKNVPNSTTTIIDNPPVLSPKYPLLESLSIEVSALKTNPLGVLRLKKKNIKKEETCVLEDNEIEMNIDSWDGRGKIIIIKIWLLVIYDMIGSNIIWNVIILFIQC